MKPPKFLITHNEAAQPEAAFIVHTQEPSFVGQILSFDDENELHKFIEENECVIIDEFTVIHIHKYLTSNEFRRLDWLKKRLKNWYLDYISKK